MPASNQAPPRAMSTPGNILAAAAGLCLVTILLLTSRSLPTAIYLLLTDGIIALLWICAMTGIGAAVLGAWRIRLVSIVLQVVVAAALGIGVVSLLVLGLGLIGMMSRAVVIVLIVIGMALLLWQVREHWKHQPIKVTVTPWAWLWLLVMPALGIAIAGAMIPPGVLWGDEPHGYDVVSYHLQIPREWYEAGLITPLRHNVYSFFPFNIEMHYLLAMHLRGGPWQGMYLAQFMHVIITALSSAAVFGIVREHNARFATLGALAAASPPWMALLASVAYNEGGLLLFGALAVGLVMLAMRSERPIRVAALAGAFAGLACGTKLTAVPMLLLGVPVAMLVAQVIHRRRDSMRGTLNAALIFVVVGIVIFLPWLSRNLVWTGNPVFPEATRLFSRAHFSETQVQRWQRAHSPRQDQQNLQARIIAVWTQFLGDWRFAFLLIPAALTSAGLRLRARETWFLLVLLSFILVFWITMTHLQGRFLVLLIPIAALLIGQVIETRFARMLTVFVVLGALIGTAGLIGKLRNMRVDPFLVLGLDRLSLFTPLRDHPVADDERLILVGDARTLCYDVPMARVFYRTVYDVDAVEGEDAVEAWMRGAEFEQGKTLVVIDPQELVRFAQTYWKIPPPPPDLAQEPGAVVLRK